jgi:hypothetical protein
VSKVTHFIPRRSSFLNGNLTTAVGGSLLSGDITTTQDGKFAGRLAVRTSIGGVELGLSQTVYEDRFYQRGQAGEGGSQPYLNTNLDVSSRYYQTRLGRISYGINGTYSRDQGEMLASSVGSRVDYQGRHLGLSWAHNLRFNEESSFYNGQLGARFEARDYTSWTLSSGINYSEESDAAIQSGSLRLSRPIRGNGYLGFSVNRDLQSTANLYTASLSKQFKQFNFNTSISGTSVDDVIVRVGFVTTARRYPKRWLPALSSQGGTGSVAVLIFADDNQNNIQDTGERAIEGVRVTRNGLLTGVATDVNGVALLTGLSPSTSVDIGIVSADIKV